MKTIEVLQLIKTQLVTRGDGKETPVRIVTQYWTMDGEIVFEDDPLAVILVPENHLYKKLNKKEEKE